MILILTEGVCDMKKQTEIFNRLLKESALEFANIKVKLILIIWFIYSKLLEIRQKTLKIIKCH